MVNYHLFIKITLNKMIIMKLSLHFYLQHLLKCNSKMWPRNSSFWHVFRKNHATLMVRRWPQAINMSNMHIYSGKRRTCCIFRPNFRAIGETNCNWEELQIFKAKNDTKTEKSAAFWRRHPRILSSSSSPSEALSPGIFFSLSCTL